MMVDLVLACSLEFGTAAPSPVRRERWLSHIGYVTSETPLPEHLATFTDQTATTFSRSETAILAEFIERRVASNTAQTVAGDPKDIAQQVQEEPNSPSEQPAHINELLGALSFAQIVAQVMPVNEDLDRRAARALRKRAARQQPRKLSQK